jgi:hypothetical protein
MVALWLPLVVLAASFVVNTGDWFKHKRHLQLQADAAALAGGDMLAACFNGGGGDAVVFAEATKYAGHVASFGGTQLPYSPLYNGQVGGAHKGPVSVLYQSDRYVNDTASRNDGTETNGPCETASTMFDVKVTESDLPWFFGLANTVFKPTELTVPSINAHARVQLRPLHDTNPSLPLAVPDINPHEVGVTFVNEATGAELTGCTGSTVPLTTCTFLLTKGLPVGGLNMWSGLANVNLPAAPAKIGVRVGIGGKVGSCANTSGTSAYSCFDGSSTTDGLTMIRDYAIGAPSPPVPPVNLSPPVLEGVWPTSCSGNGAFFFIMAGTCASGVTAEVNYGTGATRPAANYHVRATVGGNTQDLSPVSFDSGRNAWIWSTSSPAPFALPANGGAQPITVSWEVNDTSVTMPSPYDTCKTGGGNKCKDNFPLSPQQRFYSGIDDRSGSGPIRSIQITGGGDPNGPASVVPGPYAFSVTLGLAGSYGVHTPCAPPPSGGSYTCFATDRAVLLRLKQTNGPNTFTVDCGGGNIRDQIVNGCANRYSINPAGVCPDPTPPDPTDCVPVQPGGAVGQVRQGMNTRFAPGSGCLANNYPTVAPGDPRVIIAMITDFSAFNGGGGALVPVITYGAFYLTGWDGAPGSCDNEPFSNTGAAGSSQDGYIWGHFIKYVDVGGTGGSGVCDPSGLLPCVPMLTQ